MLEFITDIEFLELSGGESIPDNFESLVIEASSYINEKTFGRITDVTNEIKYTTCQIILLLQEEYNQLKNSNVKSQNIEGWSETYATPNEIKEDFEKRKYKILKSYLWNQTDSFGIPLLYVGV